MRRVVGVAATARLEVWCVVVPGFPIRISELDPVCNSRFKAYLIFNSLSFLFLRPCGIRSTRRSDEIQPPPQDSLPAQAYCGSAVVRLIVRTDSYGARHAVYDDGDCRNKDALYSSGFHRPSFRTAGSRLGLRSQMPDFSVLRHSSAIYSLRWQQCLERNALYSPDFHRPSFQAASSRFDFESQMSGFSVFRHSSAIYSLL